MTLAALIKESLKEKEAWHYTSLVPYTGMNPQAPVANDSEDVPPALTLHRLVFVDGRLSSELSNLTGLPDTVVTNGDVEGHYRLVLAGQSCLAIDPIEITYINSLNKVANEASLQLDVELGENSRLTLIERHVGEGSELQARHQKTNIILAPQSKLVHGKVVSGHAHTLHAAQTKVDVAAGAFYDNFTLISGGKLVRCENEIILNGKLAEARLIGGMLLAGKDHGDITSVVQHKVPHSASHQVCKTVLAESARGVFQGKVHVDQAAQKTEAYQLCRSLLLSSQAEMNAKPELEIYADDVKCSHGTAIGDLDEDALFYMLSRGIDKETARRMLIDAFMGELVDEIKAPELAAFVRKEVDEWLLM